MTTLTAERTTQERIAMLNDAHRRCVGTSPRRCYLTQGIAACRLIGPPPCSRKWPCSTASPRTTIRIGNMTSGRSL